ncbi:hypothetical protein RhiLY_12729 [Ceratobasidium sp. AG-Ba]|nr:hypothetical protein RhiLY_12729 [Ceratobasidium sp. AG-Ba]
MGDGPDRCDVGIGPARKLELCEGGGRKNRKGCEPVSVTLPCTTSTPMPSASLATLSLLNELLAPSTSSERWLEIDRVEGRVDGRRMSEWVRFKSCRGGTEVGDHGEGIVSYETRRDRDITSDGAVSGSDRGGSVESDAGSYRVFGVIG